MAKGNGLPSGAVYTACRWRHRPRGRKNSSVSRPEGRKLNQRAEGAEKWNRSYFQHFNIISVRSHHCPVLLGKFRLSLSGFSSKVSTALAMVLDSRSVPACCVGASSGPPLLEWTAAESSTLSVHKAPSVWGSSLLCLPHCGHGTLSPFCLLRPEITNWKPRGRIYPANMFLFCFGLSLSN